MVCVHWMREGVFNGVKTPNPDVEKSSVKFGLDAPSACKLAQVLESRDDADECLRRINTHLERSNKPSEMVMKMLKEIKSGNVIDECTHAPSVGSYLHKLEQKEASRKSRSQRRGRSPAKQRARSRSRERRSRDRDRDKRSRDRDRDKRSRTHSRDKR